MHMSAHNCQFNVLMVSDFLLFFDFSLNFMLHVLYVLELNFI